MRALLALIALPALAQPSGMEDPVRSVALLEGWRQADGSHIAALRIELAPGWKTYWRAPGGSGIPPMIVWQGSENIAGVGFHWPTPTVFDTAGEPTVGYVGEMTLPIRIEPQGPGPIRAAMQVSFGVCEEICIPATAELSGVLGEGGPDPRIAAALADGARGPEAMGIAEVACAVRPNGAQDFILTAEIAYDRAPGAAPHVVFELPRDDLWITEAETALDGRSLRAEAELLYYGDGPFAMARDSLRLTLIGGGVAVDIQGCG